MNRPLTIDQRNDRLIGFVVMALALAALIFAIASCAGPRTKIAESELDSMLNAATADGVVTPEEHEALDKKADEIQRTRTEEEGSLPWMQLILAGLGVYGASVGTVRYTRGPSSKSK